MAEPREVEATFTTAATALVTIAETEVAETPRVQLHQQSPRVLVIAHAKLTTGAGTTAVVPRIRRGTSTAGTLVGDETGEAIKAAAGSTEEFSAMVVDTPGGVDSASYVLTLSQTGATGNGSCVEATIIAIEF
jgi:hypothetical protein